MDFFPWITEIQENHRLAALAEKAEKDKPRPGFGKIFDAQLEQRRLERLRAGQTTGGQNTTPESQDYSMCKLYQSLLLRLGGPTPNVQPGSPNASTVLHESLKNWRSGSRRLFSRDSDLHSMPQFPVVRFKET